MEIHYLDINQLCDAQEIRTTSEIVYNDLIASLKKQLKEGNSIILTQNGIMIKKINNEKELEIFLNSEPKR